MFYKILLVEDDRLYGETISEFLEDLDFTVEHHLDGTSAINASFSTKFHLYIFDINLPSLSGIELLQELRSTNDTTPTIYLTSSNDHEDLQACFKAGCDDFIKKPVALDELELRIHALLRRSYGEETLTFEPFRLDQARATLYKHDTIVPMKPKAFALLRLLVQNADQTVTLETIQTMLYTPDKEASLGAIRVYLNEIKNAIGEEYITNIRGVGYRFAQA